MSPAAAEALIKMLAEIRKDKKSRVSKGPLVSWIINEFHLRYFEKSIPKIQSEFLDEILALKEKIAEIERVRKQHKSTDCAQ